MRHEPGDIVLVAGKDPSLERGGGHSSYVRAHARAAVRAGFRPRLFCVSLRSRVSETDFGTVHAIRSRWPISGPAGTPAYLGLVALHHRQLSAAVATHLARGQGPAVVHGFGPYGATAVAAAARAGAHRRVVAIWSAYTLLERESRSRLAASRARSWRHQVAALRHHLWVRLVLARYEACALREAALTLVNYESVQRLLQDRFGIPARWRRLPYTSESAFHSRSEGAHPKDARVGAPLIVALSRQDARKGVHVLLEALARLRRQGVPFQASLMGGGQLLAAHRRLASRLGLDPATTLPGFVEDPLARLAGADVFALPSLTEGSGSMALVEALQAGRASVVSAVDGLLEDITHGVDGLLVPPGDPAALAEALRALLADPGLRTRLGTGARRTFETRFAPERLVEALHGTYRTLLDGEGWG